MFWTLLVRTSIWVRKSIEEIFILKPCSWGRNHFIHPCLGNRSTLQKHTLKIWAFISFPFDHGSHLCTQTTSLKYTWVKVLSYPVHFNRGVLKLVPQSTQMKKSKMLRFSECSSARFRPTCYLTLESCGARFLVPDPVLPRPELDRKIVNFMASTLDRPDYIFPGPDWNNLASTQN